MPDFNDLVTYISLLYKFYIGFGAIPRFRTLISCGLTCR